MDENLFHHWLNVLEKNPSKINEIPENLKKNSFFAYEVVNKDGLCFACFPENLKKNKAICLAAVGSNIEAFLDVDDSLKNDQSFLLACIELNGAVFFEKFISDELTHDYAFCLQAVARHDLVLECVPAEFKTKQMV